MAALTVSALAALAIVTQDRVALRAAPRDSAAQHALLWQGDNLEIRGEKGDFLQVYDHRHERAGYVRATQVRTPDLRPSRAAELKAVVHYLRDTPGAESLGLAHAAAYLQAAPAESIDSDIFDALGTMAERLAQRANDARPGNEAQAATAHLEVAASYGVTMATVANGDTHRLCYDGDAFRRVLALPASDVQKARAALALTRHECVTTTLTPTERHAQDIWRADVLDRVATTNLPPVLTNRLHMRKAGVWASLAWQRARRPADGPEPAHTAVQAAAYRAVDALAAINKAELAETDATGYNLAAMRVGASRWATDAGLPPPSPVQPSASASGGSVSNGSGTPAAARVKVVFEAGQPGETCIRLLPLASATATAPAQATARSTPVFSRCTYGQVWPASATWHPQGQALAVAVQPTDTWRELWLIRQDADGWHADVLPPAADGPGLGYIEWAGWVPGGTQLLTAREASTEGPYPQRYEVRRLDTLAVQAQADKPGNLSPFYRWQAPAWKARTVSLR